jgi:hypothetical protein
MTAQHSGHHAAHRVRAAEDAVEERVGLLLLAVSASSAQY